MQQVVEQHWVPQVSRDKADGPHRSNPPPALTQAPTRSILQWLSTLGQS